MKKENGLKKSLKLTLSKETLRALDPRHAAEAKGGGWTGWWYCSGTCESGCDFCTN
jgi:hypothetical protein